MRLSRELLILAAILALGALLRGLYVSELVKYPDFDMPAVDALYHDYWARGIVTGNWTPPPPMADPEIRSMPYFRPPGYTWFMAGVYLITHGSYLGIRIAQMLIGLVSCLLAFLMGRRFLGPRAGLIFAALMSVYWVFIYFEGELLEPVLLVVLGLWLVYGIGRWTEAMTFRRGLLSGAIMGLFALVRPNVLMFAPAVVIWAYWIARRRNCVRDFGRAVVGLALGSILMISPATIRNYVMAHEFVPISTNTGINLYIGNNELADARCVGDIPGHGSFKTCFDYPGIVSSVEREVGRELTHTEVSAYFTRKAVEYIKSEPARVLSLSWQKALLFWCPFEVGHNKEDELERMNSGVLKRIPVDFPVALALSIVGLVALAWETRRRGTLKEGIADRRFEVSVLVLLFIAAYFASYVPFFAAGRYRVPVVPFLMFFGAHAIDYGIALIATRMWTPALCWAVGLIAAHGLTSWNPTGYAPDAAKWHFDKAVDFSLRGETQRAIREYTEALRVRPAFPQAQCNLGFALMEIGKLDEAIGHFEEVLEIEPENPLPHYCMGLALSRRNETDAAIEEFRRSIELDPTDPAAHYELGLALLSKRLIGEGTKELEETLRINPSFGPAHQRLGTLRLEQGKTDEAVRHFEAAIEISPDPISHYRLGSIMAQQQKYDEAIEHFRSAISMRPDYPEAHYDLAVALSIQGKMDEAIEHFREAVRIAPSYAKAHQHLAAALYVKGDYAGAWKEVDLARKYGAQLDPEFLKALSAEMPQPK